VRGRVAVVALSAISLLAVATSVFVLATPDRSMTDPTFGTIHGQLALVGGPEGITIPVAGSIVATGRGRHFSEDDIATFTTATDPSGAYSLAIPQGRYVIMGRSPRFGDDVGICRSFPSAIVVPRAGDVAVDVSCDMK
jgi:hypothetical protein